MTNLPTVSVVIPCFNYGRFVTEAVESALRQTLAPLEIVVVDDGSTDDTAQRLAPLRERIVYLAQANRGVSAARNTGIRAARGEWIAFLDADDLWEPEKLRRQMELAAAQPELCLIGALMKTPRTRHLAQPFAWLSTRELLGAPAFGNSSAVARKDALLAAGLFNEQRRFAEDRELWLKLSLLGRVARVNTPLWEYRLHSGQAIAQTRRMEESYRDVLQRFFQAHPEYLGERRRARAYFHYDSAMSYFENAARGQALRALLASLWAHPGRISDAHAEANFSRATLLLKCVFGQKAFELARSALHLTPGPFPTREGENGHGS